MTDALCCAKAFYKKDIKIGNLKSNKFDIDIEITGQLIRLHKNNINSSISYTRRIFNQGKKLRLRDGYLILKRIFIDFLNI